jgi:polyisoprenoid-binding protein YceI
MESTSVRHSIRPGTWTLDPSRSTASFVVRGLGGKVTGTIPIVSASVQVEADGAVGAISAVLSAAGFNTGHAKRDPDVRSAKFLDAESFPVLSYSATRVAASPGGWSVQGNLVVKDVTSPVDLTAEITSAGEDTASVRATGVVDRRAAGMTKMPNWMIGRTLAITLDVAFRHAD